MTKNFGWAIKNQCKFMLPNFSHLTVISIYSKVYLSVYGWYEDLRSQHVSIVMDPHLICLCGGQHLPVMLTMMDHPIQQSNNNHHHCQNNHTAG